MIRYSFRSGQFDLIADTYTVMRRHGKDLFHIRTKTAPDEDILILSPDCGIGTAKGEWTEDAVPQGDQERRCNPEQRFFAGEYFNAPCAFFNSLF